MSRSIEAASGSTAQRIHIGSLPLVADEAADVGVGAVADALGLDRFSVVGGSGGGPRALACAALLAGGWNKL